MSAYISGNGNLLDGWPGTMATQDGTSDWWYVDIPADLSVYYYNIVFNNADSVDPYHSSTGYLVNDYDVYMVMDGSLYASKQDAENTLVQPTRIYYYNSLGWLEINATVMSETPGLFEYNLTFTQDGSTDWWYADVNMDASLTPFYAYLYYENAVTGFSYYNNHTDVYSIITGSTYASQLDAESEFDIPTRIYFYNQDQWPEVYAYATAPGDVLDAYPGTAAIQDGTSDWWYIDLPINTVSFPVTITFNNNNEITPQASFNTEINNQVDVYMLLNGNLYVNKADAEAALAQSSVATIYYYNSEGWDDVYAYGFDDQYNDLTTYPGALATEDPNHANWWYFTFPIDLNLHIIYVQFTNGDLEESMLTPISNPDDIYVNYHGYAFDNRALAEDGYDLSMHTDVYFYNTEGWTEVYAYAYDMYGSYITEWPGTLMTPVQNSNYWWTISVPMDLLDSFYVVFSDGDLYNGVQTQDMYFDDTTGVYATASGGPFIDQTTAEANLESVTRVYFYNPTALDWTTKAHVWNYEGVDIILDQSWPGQLLIQDSTYTDWWYIDVSTNTAFFNLILSDDGTFQTKDLVIYSYDEVYIVLGDQDPYDAKYVVNFFMTMGDAESFMNPAV